MDKYNDDFTADILADHGQWCLDRIVGEASANRLPIPPASIPIYAAHEKAIRDNLALNERRR